MSGFIIEDKTPRTCREIHAQIAGYHDAGSKALFECGACGALFSRAWHDSQLRDAATGVAKGQTLDDE